MHSLSINVLLMTHQWHKALVSQCTNKKHSNFKKTLTAVPSLLIITFIPNHTLNSSGISQSTMYNYTVLILSAMSMYLMSGTNINTQFTYFGAWLNYRLSLFRWGTHEHLWITLPVAFINRELFHSTPLKRPFPIALSGSSHDTPEPCTKLQAGTLPQTTYIHATFVPVL